MYIVCNFRLINIGQFTKYRVINLAIRSLIIARDTWFYLSKLPYNQIKIKSFKFNLYKNKTLKGYHIMMIGAVRVLMLKFEKFIIKLKLRCKKDN